MEIHDYKQPNFQFVSQNIAVTVNISILVQSLLETSIWLRNCYALQVCLYSFRFLDLLYYKLLIFIIPESRMCCSSTASMHSRDLSVIPTTVQCFPKGLCDEDIPTSLVIYFAKPHTKHTTLQ